MRQVSAGAVSIKGHLDDLADGEGFPGFSASGQDVRLPESQFNGEGLVLSAVGAQCGKCFYASGQWGVVANTQPFLPTEQGDARYLFYLVNQQDFWEVGGTAQPYVQVPRSMSQAVPAPSLDMQQRIARFLDEKTARIDGLIEKKRALLDRLAEKRQALITRAVTKGLSPEAPTKPSGIDWIGDIPEHWEVLSLKRVLASSMYGISASLEPSGEVAVLRMGNLVDGEIDFDDLRFLDEVDEDLLLDANDVVFNRTNSLDLVGKTSIFRGKPSFPVSLASYLVRFRFTDRYNPEYANYVMGTQVLMALGRTLALPSIGQANLNPSRYALIEFPIPPKEEQLEIVAYLVDKANEINQIEVQVSQSIESLTEYRSALITAAVTGQLPVLI